MLNRVPTLVNNRVNAWVALSKYVAFVALRSIPCKCFGGIFGAVAMVSKFEMVHRQHVVVCFNKVYIEFKDIETHLRSTDVNFDALFSHVPLSPKKVSVSSKKICVHHVILP